MSDGFVRVGAVADQVRYTIDDRGACAVVTVGGRVDSQNATGVRDALQGAGGFSSGLVVDLTRLEVVHPEAAGLMVGALQRSREDGPSVCVVGPPEPVGWLLRAYPQTAEIPICTSMDEAVALLSGAPQAPLSPPLRTSPSCGVP